MSPETSALWPPAPALAARDLVALVDEDARRVAALRGLLHDVGLRALGFTCSAEATRALRTSKIDIVVVQYPTARLDELVRSVLAAGIGATSRPGLVLLAEDPARIDPANATLADAVAARSGCAAQLLDAIERARSVVRALARPRSSSLAN